jgi:hypothetical protein
LFFDVRSVILYQVKLFLAEARLSFKDQLQNPLNVRLLLAGMTLNSLPLGFTLVVLPIYLSEIGFSASAITSMIWGIGNSFGPVFAGIFLSSQNYFSISMPLTLGGGIYLASAIAFYLFFRKIHPPEEMKG